MSQTDNLRELLATLEAAADHRRFNKMLFYEPYVKQQEFLDNGSMATERLFMAGNQNGKSETGAFETACHLTGLYPDWWLGRRWERPVKGWAAGESSLLVRDVQQKKLCGEPGLIDDFGTGMIPKHCFHGPPSLSRGVTDAFDTIHVDHYTNGVKDGVSILKFKSYEQGRTKFQGDTIDFFWGDEEAPADVYSEMVTRITATSGMGFMTFTPLKGMSEVVMKFLNEASSDRRVTTMTIHDALHIPQAERAAIISRWPAHEREARAKGVPMLGSGRIFAVSEESISEPAIEHIPAHWFKLWGIDFGIGHPFAAVLILWDKDNDVIHVHHCYRQSDTLPMQHAAAMKPIGINVPVAWPQDGTQRRGELGTTVKDQYKNQGLKMLGQHAAFPDGSNSTESGILEMQERMETGRFKVASHLSQWWEEFRLYHRKDGLIVKLRDDLMSASRIAVMAKRFAKQIELGSRAARGRGNGIAEGVDFDPF